MPLLTLDNISKSFAGFKANDDVSLTLERGEIHALLGENGAGKSTLVKILYGVQKADSGSCVFDGKTGFFKSPREARANGVTMVYQHFSLFEGMTVLENIALGLDETLDFHSLKLRVQAILERYALPLDPDRMVHSLSVGERQRIEIVRCLLQDPKLLIMDEPTSVLTPQEVQGLFDTLIGLKKKGCSILYISHKLHEIKQICDNVTILRAGKVVASQAVQVTSITQMAEIMIGEPLKGLKKNTHHQGETLLQCQNLGYHSDDAFTTNLDDICFEAKKGEILGIAGVAGNGQSELMLALSGEIKSQSHAILFNNKPIGELSPALRRASGLHTLPEERNGHAGVPELSLTQNALLTNKTGQLIDWRSLKAFSRKVINLFDVRASAANPILKSLSGGNIQKFLVGREILQDPRVLVISQPTWGVDAGAASHIRQELIKLAENGAAVIILSQDLDELFELSDKLCVLANGKLSPVKALSDWTTQSIGFAMSGNKMSGNKMSGNKMSGNKMSGNKMSGGSHV
jgi:simple sugar transport system ATP-binding protein